MPRTAACYSKPHTMKNPRLERMEEPQLDFHRPLTNYTKRSNGRSLRFPNVITYSSTIKFSSVDTAHKGGRAEDKDIHKVISVEGCDLQIAHNAKEHHTDEYDICGLESGKPGKLVVRRGQCFNIKFLFTRPYDRSKDDLRIVFEAGDNPSSPKGTEIEMILSDKDFPKQWGAKILKQEGNFLTVTIFTPPDCYVGKWELSVDVIKKGDTDRMVEDKDMKVFRYEHDDPIYIIFNPWCKDDVVYLGDESQLQEYVMNESGLIYVGNQDQISSRPWNFGQFESCALDVALCLLDITELPWAGRGNPAQVVRKISAGVNCNDEGGILAGNWSGNYAGGRSPLSWSGSMAILEQYWETRRPVKYGQCWVFSGLCTTIARALGIPTRSVTNFQSAHDKDGSITVDVRFDKDGHLDKFNSDSIWNFHVWNEAWMARPDLPTGFDGWQAFDATPQETSDGVMCCGPVSVKAIRQGEVNLPFDAPFMFAEVNADRVFWQPDCTGTLQCCKMEKSCVGKAISTKLSNSSEREDITSQYKAMEGTNEERAIVIKANRCGSTRPDIYKMKKVPEDCTFEVVNMHESCFVGQEFKVALKVTNNSQHQRTIEGHITVNAMYYTGVVAEKIGTFGVNKSIMSGKSETFYATVKADIYFKLLKDHCMLDVSKFVTVKETKQSFVNKKNVTLRKPQMTIKGPGEARRAEEFEVEISFTNPLDISLTECFVTVDGLARSLRFPQRNVHANGTFVASLPITPSKIGKKELVVIFSSKELDDINGSKSVFVIGNTAVHQYFSKRQH